MTVSTASELLQEFTQRARACNLSPDVLGAGDLNAEIAIVAEAPGEMEMQMRMPLVGGSGRYLWEELRRYGINRTDCYITNVLKTRSPMSFDSVEKSSIPAHELAHWTGLLGWELDQLPKLRYVLSLGGVALQALTGNTGIRNWRGSVVPIGNRVYTFTYNPAAILRDPKDEVVFRFDLAKFNRVVTGSYKEHKTVPHYNLSPKESIECLTKLQDEKLPTAFDIEVIANETACIGFANNAIEGYCINFRDRATNRWSAREETEVRTEIQKFFDNPSVKLVAQNGNYDSYWLWYKDRIKPKPIWLDTLLAHHTLYPLLPHSLAFLTSQYTEHPFYKEEGRSWREGGDINVLWEYNVKDVCITKACQVALLGELQAQKMDDFFFKHVMRIQPQLIRMTANGVLADELLKAKITEELREDVKKLEAQFHEAVQRATRDPNMIVSPRSPSQLRTLFFNRLGLAGRGHSVDEENRARILSNPSTPLEAKEVIYQLDKYMKEHKFLSTYAEMSIDEDGRVRCEYKQFGTKSAPGRLSSSMVMWGTGMNLQNQPIRARKMFIAPPGYGFCYFDLSQAEARVVSEIWNVKALKENFQKALTQKGFDVHRANAANIFQVPYDEVPEKDHEDNGSPTRRYLGKRCVHGLNYRMGPDKLASVCEIPMSQALEAHMKYHIAFPEIRQGWRETIARVQKDRKIYTPMGRRLIVLGRLDEEVLDAVVAFVPQSTIGDKVARVIYLCHEDPEWPPDAAICLNIHDALIAVAPVNKMAWVSRVMKKHAEEPIYVKGAPLFIPAEVQQSVPGEDGVHRWTTLKKVTP